MTLVCTRIFIAERAKTLCTAGERDVCDKCRIRELQGLVSELQGLVKQCIAMLKKYAASSPEVCKLIEKSMAAREMTILGGGKDSSKMHTDR